jgi:adenine-specific DNA-methyltransferase
MRASKRSRKNWGHARRYVEVPITMPRVGLWQMTATSFLKRLPERPVLDLVLTSPPYNLGKEYETDRSMGEYLRWQRDIIEAVAERIRPNGSVCWQVGNYVDNGRVEPLDFAIHRIFRRFGFRLRNRIVWHFGHGLHCRRRFSGRYEVILWYTKADDYVFNLDAVRIPAKYPGKRSYHGPNNGRLSGNPLGKNPEDVWRAQWDVWNIPNVKGNHREKTMHPCQFPVGLAERLVLALSNPRDVVLDPFCGVGSTGVAATIHNRDFWGCDVNKRYLGIAETRINDGIRGEARYRPHDQPLYDYRRSSLSIDPRR